MHVKSNQPDVLHRQRLFRDPEHVLVLNPELAPLLAGLDVLVRRLERDLRIYPDADRHDLAELRADPFDGRELTRRLDVDEENAGFDTGAQLVRGLAHATKDGVGGLEARGESSMELTAGNDVDAAAQFLDETENAGAGIRLGRIVNPMRDSADRAIEQRESIANRRRAVDVRGRPHRRGNPRERHSFAVQCAADSRKAGLQYAFAQTASAFDGRPHFRQLLGASADWNSSSGRQRMVALVSVLISSSQVSLPQIGRAHV